MKFDPKYFIGLARVQGMDFKRHGDTVSYLAKDELPIKLGKLLIYSATKNLDELLDFLPDEDKPAFQLDLFRNL